MLTSSQNAISLLLQVKQALRAETWYQGGVISPDGSALCLISHLTQASDSFPQGTYDLAYEALRRVLRGKTSKARPTGWWSLGRFNDSPSTKLQHVHQVLVEAAELLSQGSSQPEPEETISIQGA